MLVWPISSGTTAVHTATIGSVLFGIGFLVAGGFVVLVSGRYVWRTLSIVRATAVPAVGREHAGNMVRVTGTAARIEDRALVSPFSGVPSLAVRYEISERRISPILLPWFVTIFTNSASVPFALDTGTQTISVGSASRTVTTPKTVVTTLDPDESPPEYVSSFERKTDSVPVSTRWRNPPRVVRRLSSALGLGTRKYTEARVTPGDEVTVVGRVSNGEEATVTPLVVSSFSPMRSVFRMASTSLTGFSIGTVCCTLGVALVALS
ncbi:hypothetical protein ACH9L7_16450 (plasmid) [Haloferax sp. S1W]|uniref:hypothetical protein n=1 Tax=Haloferax sp. S1W TaxID=3377110 RepID=UPI0037C7F13D